MISLILNFVISRLIMYVVQNEINLNEYNSSSSENDDESDGSSEEDNVDNNRETLPQLSSKPQVKDRLNQLKKVSWHYLLCISTNLCQYRKTNHKEVLFMLVIFHTVFMKIK